MEGRQLDISQRLNSTSSSGLGIDLACCSVLSSGPGAVLLSLFLIAQSISLITMGCRVSHAGSRTGSGVLLSGMEGVSSRGHQKPLLCSIETLDSFWPSFLHSPVEISLVAHDFFFL